MGGKTGTDVGKGVPDHECEEANRNQWSRKKIICKKKCSEEQFSEGWDDGI
jgi:hypothetical protein